MRKSVRKTALILYLFAALSVLFGACGRKTDAETENKFYIYYQEQNHMDLYPVEAVISYDVDAGVLVSSIWERMKEVPEGAGYVSVVPQDLNLKSYSMDKHDLILNFSSEYSSMSFEKELLFRAALVKTYCQLPSVSTLEIRVDNQPLTLQDGTVFGPQRGSYYVDVMGNGLNAYQEADVVLYFSSEDGTSLVPEPRHINYNTTYPLEQQIVQLLIQGPGAESGLVKVFPEQTKLISIQTKNNICHVNLNNTIVTEPLVVSPQILVYSIVNTLTELPGISMVQITVNGSPVVSFMDELSLEAPLERDLDYVLNTEQGGETAETVSE